MRDTGYTDSRSPIARARSMTDKKKNGIQPELSESEYIESILDALDREMAGAGKNSGTANPKKEMDLLVADLLGYLEIQD